MKKNNSETISLKKNYSEAISRLKYSIERYQRMGNGTMCQTLLRELEKLRKAQRQFTPAF